MSVSVDYKRADARNAEATIPSHSRGNTYLHENFNQDVNGFAKVL